MGSPVLTRGPPAHRPIGGLPLNGGPSTFRRMPQKAAGNRMTATLVRFGPELHAQLKDEAQRESVSVAQYVREAVSEYIASMQGRREQ